MYNIYWGAARRFVFIILIYTHIMPMWQELVMYTKGLIQEVSYLYELQYYMQGDMNFSYNERENKNKRSF